MKSPINVATVMFKSRFLKRRFLPLGLLALTALVLYLAHVAPAGAQSNMVLVSNTGQNRFGVAWEHENSHVAHGFVTGSNASGYIISGIGLDVRSASATRGVVVEIRESATGPVPAQTALATLTNPSDLKDGMRGVKTFTTPTPLVLEANTRYYMVISCATGTGVCITTERGSRETEDAGAATGWSIDDRGSQERSDSSWATTQRAEKVYFNVQGRLLEKPLGEITATAGVSSSNSLKISWTAYTGAAAYEVHWKSGEEDFSATRSSGNELTGTEYTIPGLTAGTAYKVRVRAYDSTDNLIAQSRDFGAVGGLTLNVASRNQIIVFWNTYEGADDYTLRWKQEGETETSATVEPPDSGSTVRYEINNLTKNTEYTVKVEANDHTKGIIATAEGTATTYGDVTGITVTAGTNSLSASWDATPDATGYRVDVREPDAREDSGETTVSGTSATTTGLKSGTQYEVEVYALSIDGDTITDGTATVTTKPGTIADLSLTPETRNSIIVFWKPFERASSYTVKWQQGSQAAQSATVAPSVGTIRHDIDGLTKNTEYTITVEAVETKESSDTIIASAQGKATTYNDVTGITVTAGLNSLRTSWDAAPDARSYRVDVREPGDTQVSAESEVSGRTAITTGLESGTLYEVTVEALGEDGDGITDGATTATTTTVTTQAIRESGKDFDTLIAASNGLPQGLWSDGTTMWVVDSFDDKIYAYNLNTKARDSAKDFNTLAGSSLKRPYGLWSDGTTMWVADYFEEKIFAYSMSTKARDESKDFNTLTAAGNREPFGIWSDGTTMWVADFGDEKLYAYDMSTKARDSAKDFGTLTAAGNGSPRGLWADGTTMWIADVADNKIYAYTMSTKARESANDIVGLADHGNDRSWGIWSNGRTIWVSDTTDKKLYAYRLPARAPSAPTGLTATAGGVTVIDLSWTDGGAGTAAAAASYGIEVSTAAGTTWNDLVANTMSPATTYRHMGIPAETTRHYRVFAINEVGISTAASNVADATTTAPTTVTGAPTGLTATADGRTQISLSWTAPAPTVTGGSATSYQIQVSTDGGTTWTDLVEDTMSTTTTYSHTGLSPGTARHYRVWAINALGTSSAASNVASAATAFFARDSAKDITLDSANGLPQGIWSDGTTIWVANFGFAGNTPKLFAYTLSDGARDSAKDFNTLSAAGNTAHQGLWSDGTTMWVADATDDKIYAYNLSTRARDSAKDFNNLAAGGNSFPAGIWSNGNTMWVADAADDKIYAYNLSTKARDSARDNDALAAASNSPVGIWSDGTTMWVMNQDDKKLYAYSLPAAPGAPTSLTATADGQTEIDLSWTAPESTDAGATAASYQIEVSLDRGANWSVLVADTGSTATTYSHTGLVAGTTRHYRVSAVNSDGTGSASNTANATTAAPTTATGAPTALTATAVGQTQIDLSWTAPTPTATGGAAASYKIEVSADEGTNWTDLVADTGNAATTYSHTGLTVGSARHYRVSAINSFGTGSASGTASATTPAPPDAPTALTATADGQTKIDLSWTAPAGGTADHKAATSYKIEVSTDGGTNWNQLVADTGSTATTYSHTGLVAGTTRHYRVSAINSVGTSSASATASATTAAPTTGPGAPTNLTAAVPSKTQIDLSWTAPAPTTTGGVATGYRIEVSADGGTTWTNLVANTNSAATTYSHTGLEPGDMRHYRVSAIGAGGTGSPSNEVSASTAAEPPGAPTGLTATAVGQTRIDLSWTDASAGSNLAATSYRIEVSTDEGENWTDLVANTHSAATTAKHRGVPAGATRHYRVSGINPAGTGSPSTAASATTAVPTTPPDAPTGLTATANGQTRIDLSWTAPAATPAGGSAAGYRIEASPSGNDDTWTTLVTDTGTTATTYSHTGLTAGTLRHYRVSAVNSVGASGPSNTAFATTAMPSVSLHADNGAPYGIWSDGTTMCVLDNADARIYAYNLATGARDEGKEFDTFSDLARIHRRVVASLPDRGLRAWQDGGESMTPALERSEGPRS